MQYLLGAHNCAPDRAVWNDGATASVFTAGLQEAFAQGGTGPAYELTLISHAWGFSLEDISIPVTFWHGGEDKTVPASMAAENHKKAPRSILRILPAEGHFSLPVNQMENILRGFNSK